MISERDKIFIDYKRIKVEMQGISPKLSTYQKLEAQANELLKRLGGASGIKEITGPVRQAKAKLREKREIEIGRAKPRPACRVRGCENPCKLKKTNKRTGVRSWHPRCGTHQRHKAHYI